MKLHFLVQPEILPSLIRIAHILLVHNRIQESDITRMHNKSP